MYNTLPMANYINSKILTRQYMHCYRKDINQLCNCVVFDWMTIRYPYGQWAGHTLFKRAHIIYGWCYGIHRFYMWLDTPDKNPSAISIKEEHHLAH